MDVFQHDLLQAPELQQSIGALIGALSRRPAGDAGAALQSELARVIETSVEQRLAVVLEWIGQSFYSVDREWRFSYINRTAEAYFGIPRQDMLGRVIWDVFPWLAGTDLHRRYEEVLASGQPTSFEAEALRPCGRYVEFHVFPYNGGLGISHRDWTAQRRAEEVLHESQAQLSALADNLPLGMVYQMNDAVGFEERRFLYISASCERLNGVPAEMALKNPHLLYDLILPEHREPTFRKQREAHSERKPFDIEFALRHAKTGEIRWHRIVDAPRRLPNGTFVWDGIQIDITEHRQAEDRLRLLVNELNHRVKNTLATVQSLAAQSFSGLGQGADDVLARARQAFEARLFALARGHDVLTRESWEGAHLAEIVAEAFAPYRRHPDGREILVADGPDLSIPPSTALSLSMALHELCTNALKYGALKVPGGHVRVAWSVAADHGERRLRLRWEEHGGPPVAPPARKGFGSRLIEVGLSRELNGTARLAFEPAGVVCAIDVPL